jgi:hypothetical protein
MYHHLFELSFRYRNHTLISHNFLIRTYRHLLTCFQLPRSLVQNLQPSKLLRSEFSCCLLDFCPTYAFNEGNDFRENCLFLYFFRIHVFVCLVLSCKVPIWDSVFVLCRIWVSLAPESRCHVVEGTFDCSSSQGSITWLQKSPFTDSHGKTAEYVCSFASCEVCKKDVPCKSCMITVLIPLFPRLSMVIVCTSLYRCCTGSFCSSKVSQETILLGRGTILKEFGTCEGTWVKKWVSFGPTCPFLVIVHQPHCLFSPGTTGCTPKFCVS